MHLKSLVSNLLVLTALTLAQVHVAAANPIVVNGSEDGVSIRGGFLLWHDTSGEADLADAQRALADGAFREPERNGSTGLEPGAFWSAFSLRNTTGQTLDLRLEYIDHQLISLRAFQADSGDGRYRTLVDLALTDSFKSRPVAHHRFVVPVEIPAGQTADFLVRYGSHQMGFVFPELRIRSLESLAESQAKELATIMFIVGGLLIMALISLIGGISTGVRFFYVYSLHALASIAVWFTVLGFTHQFLLREGFHWRYMSMTGALSLFTGLYFAREFLRTRKYTPKFDYLLLFMIFNSVFLFVTAMVDQTALSVISITLALLLYPTVSVVALFRWYQGAQSAGLFTIAWTFLVIGLFQQALRDLGVVEHNLVNYYWPAVAVYGEMTVILVAMGLRIRDLRLQKEAAERARMEQMQQTQVLLETQVAERTRELEAAKTVAELEARTDTLTGVSNRRSFMASGQKMLDRMRREGLPLNLLMLDLDHFKEVNDSHGHDVGDRALVAFAKTVAALFRDRDLFGRIGGEEFALMLSSTTEEALEMAKRLREEVRSLQVETDSGPIGFTISIGIAPLDGETRIEALLKRADGALYAAKTAGRDRAMVAPREEPAELDPGVDREDQIAAATATRGE